MYLFTCTVSISAFNLFEFGPGIGVKRDGESGSLDAKVALQQYFDKTDQMNLKYTTFL